MAALNLLIFWTTCLSLLVSTFGASQVVSNYTVKLTNLTSKYLIGDEAKDTERCTISHIPNTEFYLTFWSNYDSKFCNINSALYQNNGQLLDSFNSEFDPTDGYESVYSYGIRSAQCPLLNNSISLTAITFYRKVNGESHSSIYLKLLFTHYNDTNGDTNDDNDDDTFEGIDINSINSNNNLDSLTLDWSNLIIISDVNNSDASSIIPDVSCIQHGIKQINANGDKVITSVGIMVAWEHYADSTFHDIYGRYLIVNATNGTGNNNNNNVDSSGSNVVKFKGDDYVITKGSTFLISNVTNTTSVEMDKYPYVSGSYVEDTENENNSQEMFMVTRTIENQNGYDIIARGYKVDITLKNATGYKPTMVKDDFSIAKIVSNSSNRHNYVPISQGQLSTCCWNQISLSIGGYVTFYTYFDSSQETYSLYLSYVYDSFSVKDAILVSTTSNYDYYGELIELKEETTSSGGSNVNDTNIFVLFGSYESDTLNHRVQGKLYHVSKQHDDRVLFEEIIIKTTNNNNNNKNVTSSLITFESDEHQLFYKCTSANILDVINRGNKFEISSDVMIAWTDWGYDIYGKFINFEIVLNETNKNNSNNPLYYSTTNGGKTRTTNGYFTTSKPKHKTSKSKNNGDELSETSVVFIVVIVCLAVMCISCLCVFAWLVMKGKMNIQIGGQPRMGSERLLGDAGNNVQLTREDGNADMNFSASM